MLNLLMSLKTPKGVAKVHLAKSLELFRLKSKNCGRAAVNAGCTNTSFNIATRRSAGGAIHQRFKYHNEQLLVCILPSAIFMGDEGLPKSTMLKAIKERLPAELRLAGDAAEPLMRCCDEFVHALSSTANAISDKEKKTTIMPEHIIKSLEELGYTPYLGDINQGARLLRYWHQTS
jgi:histone H3/H4